MAPRKNLTISEEVRKKIQTTQLLLRLQNNALGKLKKPMDMGEIRSAQIVLGKVLPDLQRTTLAPGDAGEDGGKVTFNIIYESKPGK